VVSVISFQPSTREFVEQAPAGTAEPELSIEALRLRVRQQEILSDFGVLALKGTPFLELLDDATRLVAEGLRAEFAKVLKYLPEDNRFLVCAGVGWGPDVVGSSTIGADMASPAGYALHTGKPVISNHLDIEERFRTPELLVQHGVRRAMNVILQGDGTPYGVLEVDSRSEGEFAQSDIVFLQGVANILGMAIERQRMEGNLRQALDRQQLLIKEVSADNALTSAFVNAEASGFGLTTCLHDPRAELCRGRCKSCRYEVRRRPNRPRESEAERRFRQLTVNGFTAAARTAEGRSELIRNFDPSATQADLAPADGYSASCLVLNASPV
jgi:hypothetical protein